MDADGILINHEAGLTIDKIVENFSVDKDAAEEILRFAATRRRKGSRLRVLLDHIMPARSRVVTEAIADKDAMRSIINFF